MPLTSQHHNTTTQVSELPLLRELINLQNDYPNYSVNPE